MNVLVKSVKSVDVPSAAEGSAGNMGIIEKKAGKSIKASGFESVTNLDIQALVDNELDSSKKDLVKTIIRIAFCLYGLFIITDRNCIFEDWKELSDILRRMLPPQAKQFFLTA